MKRAPWFPLWAAYQDDLPFLMVSADAELLYIRAVARCKLDGQGDDGGIVHAGQLDRLCHKLGSDPRALAAELCATRPTPLWRDLGDGTWLIVAYGTWNRSAEQGRAAKAAGARRGNHARWQHPGPVETCPICVPPGQSHTDSDSESDPGQKTSKTRRDETTPPDRSHTDSHTDGPDLAVVEVADQLIGRLFVDAVASAVELERIEGALRRGWTVEQITDAGLEAVSRPAVRDPRAYLDKTLLRLASENPPVTGPRVAATAARPVPPVEVPEPITWPSADVVKPGLRRARAALLGRSGGGP